MKKTRTSLNKKTKGKKDNIKTENQLREFLMSAKGFIPIEDAIKEADKKWPR